MLFARGNNFHQLITAPASLLFPTKCNICEKMNDSLQGGISCLDCWNESENEHLDFDLCEKCETFLPRLGLHSQSRPCGNCRNLAFESARSCGSYKGAFREAVLRLKISPEIPERLQTNLIDAFHRLPNAEKISVLIPIPLHRERMKSRGFNQAEVIAEALSRRTKIRAQHSCVVREKTTERHRAGMDAKKRMEMIKNAFQVRAPKIIKGKDVLLIDDVMTSGSTAHELSETLMNAGANSIRLLTIARANIFQ